MGSQQTDWENESITRCFYFADGKNREECREKGHSKMRKLCRLSATVAIDNHLSGIGQESNEMPNGLDGLSADRLGK
ncbi:hypothetical protein CDAR_423581 [Caerostris darwini]|uniref:Uncharacterized protein n=1 Tax=Caerostris darwini TaxID=1538125 RepID=A0AAV4QFP6_9ARAC|nr:hypothetical protein CDAR_423581 [Caerostris darwini]